jgi:ferrous iron transport protein A
MNNWITLAQLQIGAVGILRSYTDDHIASKLLSMGLLPGKSVWLVRRAPFGGGFYIKVAERSFAVRADEAEAILLERLEDHAENTDTAAAPSNNWIWRRLVTPNVWTIFSTIFFHINGK